MASLALQSVLLLSSLTSALASPGALKLDFTKSLFGPVGLDKRDGGSVEITLGHNARRIIYEANVTIGTPGQQFTLQVDTGSSDTWVPAASSDKCQTGACTNGEFKPADSSTFSKLTVQDGSFNISYDSPGDTDSGYYFNDILALTDSISIQNMTVGLATYAFDDQGLIGMGFPQNEASVATLGQTTPTVLYQLLSQGLISRAAFSLYMNDLNADSGSILFGGIDSSKYTGDLVSFPIQLDPQSGVIDEYVITMSSVSFVDASGKTTLLSSPDLAVAALLDSGTTSLVLPADIYSQLLDGMGGKSQGAGYSPIVPCSYAKANVSVTIGFGGADGLTVNVPISEMIADFYNGAGETYADGTPLCNFDISSQADDLTGSVILGDAFLRAAYVVYDLENQQIAVAQANLNPGSELIVSIPPGTGLPGVSSTATMPATTGSPTALGGAVTTAVGTAFMPGTPTFDLGSVATETGSGAAATATSTGTSGAAGLSASGMGTVGVSVGLGLMTLLGALLL